MDTNLELHAADATGWRAGMYDDIRATFRAPVVNWIWRTATANHPDLTRYLWGQVKPAFGTRAFAEASVAYRDAVLSAVDCPRYRPGALDLAPAEVRELRGQIATFDAVAPRLAVLFELVDRATNGGDVGSGVPDDRAATEPYPAGLDADRGLDPSMVAVDAVPEGAADAVAGIRAFHGFDDDSLPSVYRCLAQWPGFLSRLWTALEPELRSDDFDAAVADAGSVVDEYVGGLAYRPALSREAVVAAGFDGDAFDDIAGLFAQFNGGPVETVIPALPVFAESVGASGPRRP
ncbi:halocarboxylic acid dehydrogenase DehI family protein [Halobaculum sp. CBA1158]|uniref:halocarboxylic acid dehydrogenase DehI family protein n=1 Tax=Halobaculum sp. CBA1158 TaxID=2904243 RepID=UPI001F1A0BB2|nr:halocarboxylic acid dehydrogenase DehI family protein [Halobaculum sp. CBA1158]UIO99033.1 halocarboxylic acid dehydrogenase DehI family protein [Halobaculum sp. CBA1158]